VYPGLMRTGSPRHALFKGQNEAEYAWFKISDSLPLLTCSAEHAARTILNACRRREAEVVLTLPAQLAILFNQVFPEFSSSLLAFDGLRRGTMGGVAEAVIGGCLVERGLSGHCHMYAALGVNTAQHNRAAAVSARRGVKVVRAVTISKSADELYRFWRNFENLPHFMRHLESVTCEDGRSHWVARGPAGMSVSRDAEIINEEPNRLIAWRSLEGSQVSTAGSVHFTPAPGDRGTEVRVVL